MSLYSSILVAAGCAMGGLCRFWLTSLTQLMGWTLIGTVLVNVLGSFLAGAVISLTLDIFSQYASYTRYFILIGFLGGLTTFSAFATDVLGLLRDYQFGAAMLHVGLNVFLSILAVFAGFILVQGLLNHKLFFWPN